MNKVPKYLYLAIIILVVVIIFTVIEKPAAVSHSSSVVDNSPYPEFMYVNNKVLAGLTKTYINGSIPSFLLPFVEGVYLDGEDPGEMAVKTPLWWVAIFLKVLNLLPDEDIHAERGFIFIHSHYKGAPKRDFREKYLIPGYEDLVIYLNDSVLCAKFERDNRAYFHIAVSKDRIPYIEREIIEGLKSVDGIKVIRSRVEVEGDLVVMDIVLNAGVEDLGKLMTDLNLSYVPITVKVKGNWTREEDRYFKGSDYLLIYTPPLDRDATLTMIKRRLEIVKERSGMYNYQGWYVEEYQNNSKKLYICT
ncbi:hypothetical protein KKP90_05870, partial [Methanothermococcus sp. SCGC AD-155-E23]|nr:hypothetical protein [Methanothermococcus sp. SCGC AD-155-E23]